MSRIFFFILTLGLLVSCKGESTPTTPSAPAAAEVPAAPPAMTEPSAASATEKPPAPANPTTAPTPQSDTKLCYIYQSAKDLIRLNLTLSGANASGILEYRLNGKNPNTGEIRGQVQGDVLYALYSFQSEGKTSNREVAFKLTAQEAREGIGEMWELGGRTLFKNRNGLNFGSSFVMRAVPCP